MGKKPPLPKANNSQYDPNPLNPNNKGGDQPPNPDSGKNLDNHVPDVTVNWNTPPSFNDNPPGGPSGDAPPTDVLDSGPITFDAGTVRSVENSLLAHERTATDDYTSLRNNTLAAIHNGTFFGPAHVDGQTIISKAPKQHKTDPPENQLHDMAAKFAADMNPLMERALEQMGNSLQLLGDYITMINQAGQSYAQTDRAARFPAPPA